MSELTPKQIVDQLDRYIIGQDDAKRSVAIAIRNRWRRLQLPEELREEVGPKNIIMSGPTGVGKTEIARRLASLVNAPFIKVEATKYTEVGYHGRDVESIIRDLVDLAVHMVSEEQKEVVRIEGDRRAEERLLDALLPAGDFDETANDPESADRRQRSREKMRVQLREGMLEDRLVEVRMDTKLPAMGMFATAIGPDQFDPDVQGLLERLMPSPPKDRRLPIREARKIFFDQECEKLIDRDKVKELAIQRTENSGIVFLDEIDKVAMSDSKYGPDISRQGVQRDLLPIVEGCTVNTKHGGVRTDHILFVAAGAFHSSKVSDMMPELQGRFPIRVELDDLTKEDFVRILTEPENALTKQQRALLATEGVFIDFTSDGVEELATIAAEVNHASQNIGARRLQTVMDKVLEEISFDAPDLSGKTIAIDSAMVREKLAEIRESDDLSRFVL